jgi:methyltransferase (TIGR00027 family)
MQIHRPSVTALVTAYVRAYHALDPQLQALFNDTAAPRLFTDTEWKGLSENLAQVAAMFDPEGAAGCTENAALLACSMRVPTRTVTLARSRFAEDHLMAAIADGTTQYIQIGAGLDTFVQRHPELADTLVVLELDHPATQADKRERLARAGFMEGANLHFVPVDLAITPLESALNGTVYNPALPAFFSWLGVSYYLPESAVFEVFSAIARLAAPGSHLVFDYLDDAAFGPAAAPEIARVQAILQHIGEPFITTLSPAKLSSELAARGVALTQDLDADAIESCFYTAHLPGYRAARHFHFVHARVEGKPSPIKTT